MNPSARFRVNKPKVVHENFGDEIVLVHFESGNYYSVGKVGTEIWELIERGKKLGEIVSEVAQRYRGKSEIVEYAIKRFIVELKDEGLIVESDADGVVGTTDSVQCTEHATRDARDFEPPNLAKFTDMQQLILLDPIHKVDETGWPVVKPNS